MAFMAGDKPTEIPPARDYECMHIIIHRDLASMSQSYK